MRLKLLRSMPWRRRLRLAATAVLLETAVMRLRGYPVPGRIVVRCRRGHLFTTIWIPAASLKSLRLGWRRRLQYCPVGRHWSLVTPVKESALGAEERLAARAARDIGIP